MDAIEAAGKKASSLTRKTQQRLLSERNSLLKKYGLEKLKSGFFSSKSGFSGVVDSVKKYAFMIFGIKTTKSNRTAYVLECVYSWWDNKWHCT